MKYAVFVFLFLYHAHSICGQTLARYGDHVITRNEFLAAFKKNNIHGKATGKAYRDYLNLYIRYRLKVQAAYDLKLDTLPGQVTELQNFKSQIIDQYMLDESSMNQMAKEAFTRSQYDLRISYIFVAAPKNFLPADTAKAWKKIQEALHALKSGKDFGETVLQFSEDPFVKNNSGDIGFITVFDLPYTMETVAYQTPSGTYSPVFRTESGYIILKKTAVRPAYGRIRAAPDSDGFPIPGLCGCQSGDEAQGRFHLPGFTGGGRILLSWPGNSAETISPTSWADCCRSSGSENMSPDSKTQHFVSK